MNVQSFIPQRALEAEPWPAYALDREGRLIYVNSAWDRIALRDGGPAASEVKGTSWLAYIAGDELQSWHRALLDRVITYPSGECHLGECNTPELCRIFVSRFEPLRAEGSAGAAGMVVRTSLLQSLPIEESYSIAAPDDRRYRTPEGRILQCGGCRRVQVSGSAPRTWEFVAAYVKTPRLDVSHGICAACREVYYGIPKRGSV